MILLSLVLPLDISTGWIKSTSGPVLFSTLNAQTQPSLFWGQALM